jgi:hypothetical protein
MEISPDDKVTYFAQTDSRGKKIPFGIKSKDRTRHTYIIGKTGMGKSTVLENMAVQDIQNGNGMAFIDPHGKTADLFLQYIPEERIKDVIYFAPFDIEHPISFNVLEDVGVDKRHLVVNGLMSAFKKIWVDAWSARMEYILNNILLALLEYPGATIIGVNRMLADKDYRNKVVANVKDPAVRAFWIDEFAKYGEKYMQEAGAAIQNKIGQFISNPLVRNIIGQQKSSFDIRRVMDEKKILIINLSKGRVGEQNANLLGSMLITKIYLGAMSRADVPESVLKKLPQFYLYVDEFQNFANESFADILSEARKYKLNLTIAHQYIEQMSEEVRAAVFGNVGTMIAFRVGSFDAEVLEKEFSPVFESTDIVNLGMYQIYLKLMIDGVSSQPFSATTLPPIQLPGVSYVERIVEESRKTYAVSRAEVEEVVRGQSGGNSSVGGEQKPQKSFGDKKPFAPRDGKFELRQPSNEVPRTPYPQNVQPGPIQPKPKPIVQIDQNQRTERPLPPPIYEEKEGNGGGFGSLKSLVLNEVKTPVVISKVERTEPVVVQQPKVLGQQPLQPVKKVEQGKVENVPVQPKVQIMEKKAPTKEHLNDLRAALAGIVIPPKKEVVEPKPVLDKKPEAVVKMQTQKPVEVQSRTTERSVHTSVPQQQVNVAPKAPEVVTDNNPKKQPEPTRSEVPEDVLRKILDMNN